MSLLALNGILTTEPVADIQTAIEAGPTVWHRIDRCCSLSVIRHFIRKRRPAENREGG
jgi:hypothetical protein